MASPDSEWGNTDWKEKATGTWRKLINTAKIHKPHFNSAPVYILLLRGNSRLSEFQEDA